jgi:hypothetical protein
MMRTLRIQCGSGAFFADGGRGMGWRGWPGNWGGFGQLDRPLGDGVGEAGE